jgi:hypothetical protein
MIKLYCLENLSKTKAKKNLDLDNKKKQIIRTTIYNIKVK